MKKYLPSPTLKAIGGLRKLVYFLAENIDLHSLWGARAQAGIEHLELKGDSNKQTIVNLLIDCQKHFSLDRFIESLVTTGIVGNGFIDLSIFQAVNYELPPIENISFEIPRKSCCRIEDSCDGSIEHRPLLQTKPHKKYKCHYIKYCAVCGENLVTEVSHKWEAWHYESEKSCSQKRVCSECDEVEPRVKHDWSKWSSNSICKHFLAIWVGHLELSISTVNQTAQGWKIKIEQHNKLLSNHNCSIREKLVVELDWYAKIYHQCTNILLMLKDISAIIVDDDIEFCFPTIVESIENKAANL